MSYELTILGKGVPTEVKHFETEAEAKAYVEEITTDDTPGWKDKGDKLCLVDLNKGHTPFVHYLREIDQAD